MSRDAPDLLRTELGAANPHQKSANKSELKVGAAGVAGTSLRDGDRTQNPGKKRVWTLPSLSMLLRAN